MTCAIMDKNKKWSKKLNLILEFDVAAFCIFVILFFFYYRRQNMAIFQNHIFITMMWFAAATTVFDFVAAVFTQTGMTVPIPLAWTVNCLFYTSLNSLYLIYMLYTASYTGFLDSMDSRQVRIFKVAVSVPFAAVILIIWLSPFTAPWHTLAFSIDSAGQYHRGTLWFYVLYAIASCYLIFSMLLLVIFRKKLSPGKILLVSFYVIFIVIAILIQLFWPRCLVQCFGVSLASLVFSFYLQKPEEVLDCITGLFNQTAFIRMGSKYFKSRIPFHCISLILDDTVFLANSFGINSLNAFLREVGAYLSRSFRHSTLYYLGQGRFCVTCRNADIREMERIIFELRARFEQPWSFDTIELKLYSRMCVIECPKDVSSAEDVLDIISLISDDSRYKQELIYARDIDVSLRRRNIYIEHSLRRAFSEQRFDVYYQPLYSTREKRLIGAEALVRLKNEDGEFISPEEFIPIAERTGLILKIGKYVFTSVCRTLSEIDPEVYGIKKIDINLSVAQCMQDILADQILTIRSIYQVPSSIINMEITETAAAHTPDVLLRNMQNLSDAGIELSLDDYGSGYSNMNYMLSLPFRMIKIDKGIVWRAFEEQRSRTALTYTVAMINALGMTVLAEGVETKEQADWLTAVGCDYLQGFYFSKPLPKDEFLELMLHSNSGTEQA